MRIKSLLVFMTLVCAVFAHAGEFVAKDEGKPIYEEYVGKTPVSSYLLLNQWFTFPSEVTQWASIPYEELGVVFSLENSNPQLVTTELLFNESVRRNQVEYTINPDVTGVCNLTLTVTYEGNTVSCTRPIITKEMPANPITPVEKPNIYGVGGLKQADDKTQDFVVYMFFNFPKPLNDETTWEDFGITYSARSSNQELIEVEDNIVKNDRHYVRFIQKGGVSGKADITIDVTMNDVTVSKTVTVETYGVLANDDSFFAPRTSEKQTIDVLRNDQIMRNAEYELSLLNSAKHGDAIVETADNGSKVIAYTPAAGVENWTADTLNYRITMFDGETSEAKVEVLIRDNPCITKVIELLPAPGQFTNSIIDPSGLINVSQGSGTSTLPSTQGLVSLGGFGGYVILGFDQPIKNDPRNPYGVDFTIAGNAFTATVKGVWTEPGAVMVMKDTNKNGLPDDGEWYELAGSDYWFKTSRRNIDITYINPKYNKRYTVPFYCSDGINGALLTNQFHQQSYFPDPENYPSATVDEITFHGTMIRSSLDKRVPSYIEFARCPAFGYADNHSNAKDLTSPSNPYYEDENGAQTDGFDISWAVNSKGEYVELDEIDFVKIYTAGSQNAGWLGEWSTEISGCGITRPLANYEPKDYYLNYMSVTQLQVVKGTKCQYEGLAFKNGRPIDEGTSTWRVSDESIGTIDRNGLFTAKELGMVTIYFKQTDKAKEDSFEIEVVELGGIVVDLEGNASTADNKELTCVAGETVYINVESETKETTVINGRKANRYIYDEYEWANSNPAIGEMNNGLFHAATPGETVLTVKSKTNPELTSEIKVIVKDIPEIALATEMIKVADNKLSNVLTNDKIFAVEGGATVEMQFTIDDTETQADNLRIENNRLKYDMTEGEYEFHMLHFEATAYGITKSFDIPFVYAPDDLIVEPAINPVSVELNERNNRTCIVNLNNVFVCHAPWLYDIKYEVDNGELGDDLIVELDNNYMTVSSDSEITLKSEIKVSATYSRNDVSANFTASLPVMLNDGLTGINDLVSNRINAYPNPASDYITIGNDHTVTLQIVSMQGLEMINTVVGAGEQIDVTALPRGIYVIVVTDSTGKHTGRLAIER